MTSSTAQLPAYLEPYADRSIEPVYAGASGSTSEPLRRTGFAFSPFDGYMWVVPAAVSQRALLEARRATEIRVADAVTHAYEVSKARAGVERANAAEAAHKAQRSWGRLGHEWRHAKPGPMWAYGFSLKWTVKEVLGHLVPFHGSYDRKAAQLAARSSAMHSRYDFVADDIAPSPSLPEYQVRDTQDEMAAQKAVRVFCLIDAAAARDPQSAEVLTQLDDRERVAVEESLWRAELRDEALPLERAMQVALEPVMLLRQSTQATPSVALPGLA